MSTVFFILFSLGNPSSEPTDCKYKTEMTITYSCANGFIDTCHSSQWHIKPATKQTNIANHLQLHVTRRLSLKRPSMLFLILFSSASPSSGAVECKYESEMTITYNCASGFTDPCHSSQWDFTPASTWSCVPRSGRFMTEATQYFTRETTPS